MARPLDAALALERKALLDLFNSEKPLLAQRALQAEVRLQEVTFERDAARHEVQKLQWHLNQLTARLERHEQRAAGKPDSGGKSRSTTTKLMTRPGA